MSWDRIRAGLGKLITLGSLSDAELTAAYNAIASKPFAERTQEDFNIANEYFIRFSGAATQIAASSGYQVVGPTAVPITSTTQAAAGMTAAQAAALINPISAASAGGNATQNAASSTPGSASPTSSPATGSGGGSSAFPIPAAPGPGRPPAVAPATPTGGIEALLANIPPIGWAAIAAVLLLFTQGSNRR
jgi:hypothetical protein